MGNFKLFSETFLWLAVGTKQFLIAVRLVFKDWGGGKAWVSGKKRNLFLQRSCPSASWSSTAARTCVCYVWGKRGCCLLAQDGRFLFCCGNWPAGPEKEQVLAQRGTLISGTMAAAESLSPGAGKNCIWPKSWESSTPTSVNAMFWFRPDIWGKWLSLAVLRFVPHAANVMFLLNAKSCW